MIDTIIYYSPHIAAGVVVLIGLGILAFTSHWSAASFFSVMATWIREDITDWARGLRRRLTGRG